MRRDFLVSFVVCFIVTYNNVRASNGEIQDLFEAQFLNVTQDVKVGAKELQIDPTDVDVIGVTYLIRFYLSVIFSIFSNFSPIPS